ncbi:unnamed protein product [Soboliphyme baturini]|uniref:LisH domain-containing protein n=1 Tax=Soboliphyme baturini TaxID=241478 RepID=A0A183IUD8_9BILA|nr:unnamed protein product [Soboliphyme baturini]
MSKIKALIDEGDVVKLILEFLESRRLYITQLSLERETGVINGCFSDDALFLRQLILDGQWDTVIDFIEPLKASPQFNINLVHFLIYKYKYFELLCIKLEPGPMKNNQFTVAEVVECLRAIESVCPKPEEYNELCALLTLSQLK